MLWLNAASTFILHTLWLKPKAEFYNSSWVKLDYSFHLHVLLWEEMPDLRSFGLLLKWLCSPSRTLAVHAGSTQSCFMFSSNLLIFSAGTETRKAAEYYNVQGYLGSFFHTDQRHHYVYTDNNTYLYAVIWLLLKETRFPLIFHWFWTEMDFWKPRSFVVIPLEVSITLLLAVISVSYCADCVWPPMFIFW